MLIQLGKQQISTQLMLLDTNNQILYNNEWQAYSVDDNQDGIIDYSFGNPDFNVKTFLSNLVLRWEYLPGSAVYLVWSHSRDSYQNNGKFNFQNNINTLLNTKGPHIFLVKFSCRIGR